MAKGGGKQQYTSYSKKKRLKNAQLQGKPEKDGVEVLEDVAEHDKGKKKANTKGKNPLKMQAGVVMTKKSDPSVY
tara:strand:- start:815 stop:1039 length:225 start_codon:yes stop_codon:yes gene_type:complete